MGYTIYKNKQNDSLKNQIISNNENQPYDWEYLELMESTKNKKNINLNKFKSNPDIYLNYLKIEESINSGNFQIDYYIGQKIKVKNPTFEDRFLKLDVDGKGYFYTVPKQENSDCLNKLIDEWNISQEPFDAIIEEIDLKNYIFRVNLTATLQEDIFRNYIIEGIPVKAKATKLLPSPISGYNMKIYFDNMELDAFMDITDSDIDILPNPSSILNKDLFVIIENYSHEKRCYKVSRKAFMESLIPEKLEHLEKGGTLYEGFITGFSPNEKPIGNIGQRNGIFIQFNDGIRGKIYESDYNDETRKNLMKYSIGDYISFYIKSVKIKKNPTDYKVSLTQVLRDHIWAKLKEGQEMIGEVFQVQYFGVLFKLDDDLVGLIHDIEIETLTNFTPKVGEKYKVRILELNLIDQKINLTLASKPIENSNTENNQNEN